MQSRTSSWIVCCAVLAMAGCAAADPPPAADQSVIDPVPAAAAPVQAAPVTDTQPATDKPPAASQSQSIAGWYMERAGQGLFQSCGDSRQMRVSGAAEALRSKASDFGLEENTPVYVRVSGTQSASGDAIEVSSVEQFGSDTPVRDCGLTGVVIPAPAKN